MGAKTSVAESVFSLCFGVAWFGETSSAGSLDFCIFNIKDNMVKCYLVVKKWISEDITKVSLKSVGRKRSEVAPRLLFLPRSNRQVLNEENSI